jgi:plasmid maintenance system killer protein
MDSLAEGAGFVALDGVNRHSPRALALDREHRSIQPRRGISMLALELERPVKISFENTKLAKTFNEEARLEKEYGANNAKRIRLRLAVLEAAQSLADVSSLPPERCHPLKGEYEGCFAVDAAHPFRLIFKPANEPLPKKDDGGLDLHRVDAVTILGVVDYH